MKKVLLIAFAVIVVLGLLFMAIKGCTKSKGPGVSNTARVERSDIAKTVIATGKVEPLYKAEIKSKIGGVVKRFFVEEGDRVAAGQKLVEVLPGTTPVEMVQTRSMVKIAAYEKQVAERSYHRQKELLSKNLLSLDEFDKTEVVLS